MTISFNNIQNLKQVGGQGGAPFTDVMEAPYALIGLEVRSGTYIDAITPVYGVLNENGTVSGFKYGHKHGGTGGGETRLYALAGYVVAGIVAKSGSLVDGFKLVYQRWTPNGVDVNDQYESVWVGGTGGSAPVAIIAEPGSLIIGVNGRSGSLVDALQLVAAKPVVVRSSVETPAYQLENRR